MIHFTHYIEKILNKGVMMKFLYEPNTFLDKLVVLNSDYDNNCFVPLEDGFSYLEYPEHNYVYNKLWLMQAQGIESYPVGVESSGNVGFPCVVKPLFNMNGMSCGTSLVYKEQFDDIWKIHNGKFFMPFLEGDHITADIVLVNGLPVDEVFVKGHKGEFGKFNYWETLSKEEMYAHHELLHTIKYFISMCFSDYTGMINFEAIGDILIEIHLRPNADLYPLYNKCFFDDLANLYLNDIWNGDLQIEKSYIIPFVADKNKEIVNYQELIDKVKTKFSIIDGLSVLYSGKPEYSDDNGRFLLVYTKRKEDINQLKLFINNFPLITN